MFLVVTMQLVEPMDAKGYVKKTIFRTNNDKNHRDFYTAITDARLKFVNNK